jgi:hypothetical protein
MKLTRKEQVSVLSALVRMDRPALAQLIERSRRLGQPQKIRALTLLTAEPVNPGAVMHALGMVNGMSTQETP